MDKDRFDINYTGNQILADVRIDGHINSEKDIYLDGFILGNVHSGGQVIVNVTGTIDGDVDCEVLFLNGKITGNVSVNQKAVLGASAEIGGGLITASLEITSGAKIGLGLKFKNASK